MQNYDIYNDIAERTGGEIYVGVVGPVRTGKSTFVSKFMEKLVIPNISGKNKKQVATDELPQSAVGKTIMTTEPKFVPANAVNVQFGKVSAKIKLIDCVGYLVDGAVGHEEDGQPRMVKTPWSSENIPFEKAITLAEYYGVSLDYLAGLTNHLHGAANPDFTAEQLIRKALAMLNS